MPYQLMQPARNAVICTGRKTNENTLTARLTRCPLRRAVACAWLTVCERQHRYPHSPLNHWRRPSPLSWRAFICAAR